MSDLKHIPLSYLLVEKGGESEPIVPFPAQFGEAPVIVTALLERTAVVASTTDQYDRNTLTFDRVLVDPAMVEWKASVGGRESETGQVPTRWNGARTTRPKNAAERQEARDAGDARARVDQVAKSKREKAELAAARSSAVGGVTPKLVIIDELHDAVLPPQSNPAPAPEEEPMPSAKVTAKTCSVCGKAKPKDQFPKTGRKAQRCNDCAAIAQVSPSAGKSQRQRDRVKAKEIPPETLAPQAETSVRITVLEQIRQLRRERDEARTERDAAKAELDALVNDLGEVLAGV